MVSSIGIKTVNKKTSVLQKHKTKIDIDNLFLTYVSCNKIVYKYLQIENDPSFYSCLLGLNKRVNTKESIKHNLTLEQITDSNGKTKNTTISSTVSSSSGQQPSKSSTVVPYNQLSQTNKNLQNQNKINAEKKNLLNIIYDIYLHKLSKGYDEKLTIKENINNYDITSTKTHHQGVALNKNDTTYNYILRKLTTLRSNNNANSINLMLTIWEKIGKSRLMGGYILKSSLNNDLEEYFKEFVVLNNKKKQ